MATGDKLVNLDDLKTFKQYSDAQDSEIKSALIQEFSDSVAYSVGEYVWHNNKVYRFLTAHSAGAWGTDAAEVKIGDDIWKNLKLITNPYSASSTYSVGDYCIFNNYIYKCKTAVTTPESFDTGKWVVVTVGSEIKAANSLIACTVPTTDVELNKILKRLYIPSSVSIDLTAVNRVTIYNGAANLYGFRMFNSSNTRLLDFTRSSTFTGLWKLGNVIADIGDISSISATSKNYYCTVNDSVLYDNQLETEYNLIPFPAIVEKDHNVLAGMAISSNAELNKIIKRLYVPASLSIDVSQITRCVVFNGYLDFYGFRLYKGTTVLVNFTVNQLFTGYEMKSDGIYAEVGDLTSINATSKEFTCSIYPSVYEENNIIEDYWESRNTKNNSISGTYTPTAQTTQGNNIGTNIKIMSYNVAKYNDDTPAEIIPAEKLHNILCTIGKINADILCIQEDTSSIDNDSVPDADKRLTSEYVYYPQYPYSTGVFQTTIRSKFSPNTYNTLTYSNGRWLGYAVFTFGSNNVLVISTHPIAGTDESSVSARATQYTEMFQWIAGTIDLNETYYDAGQGTWVVGSSVHVPDHTHCIICMDANSMTDDDKSTLSGLASTNDFVMGNGGKLGWMKTCRSRFEWYSIDNIIVSDNIIINSFEAMTEKYSDLYSDHVPVVADVTLL